VVVLISVYAVLINQTVCILHVVSNDPFIVCFLLNASDYFSLFYVR